MKNDKREEKWQKRIKIKKINNSSLFFVNQDGDIDLKLLGNVLAPDAVVQEVNNIIFLLFY